MKPQYQHELMTSFLLWFDNHLLQKGEAYSNKTGTLYGFEDSRLPSSYKVFASPYKQWVSDSSITGEVNPIIPTSFVGLDRTDDLIFDFENGRVIETGGNLIGNEVLTGEFAVKDFNVYFTNETEEDLIIENDYEINSRIIPREQKPIAPYDQVVPAVFFNTTFAQNKGFAFGGMEETTTKIIATVMSEDSYMLDGVLSIFADSHNENIAIIPMEKHPFNEFNDLKSGIYNYKNLSKEHNKCNGMYVNGVATSKLTDRARKSLSNDIFVGFIDFELQQHRFRHQ